jgi:hypothetical protein
MDRLELRPTMRCRARHRPILLHGLLFTPLQCAGIQTLYCSQGVTLLHFFATHDTHDQGQCGLLVFGLCCAS